MLLLVRGINTLKYNMKVNENNEPRLVKVIQQKCLRLKVDQKLSLNFKLK